MKKEELRVVFILAFVAVTIDPLTFSTICSVGSYGVDNLFLCCCFTSTKSPFFIVCSFVLLFSSSFSFCFVFIAASRSLMPSSSTSLTMLGSLPRISHWNISDLGDFPMLGWGVCR